MSASTEAIAPPKSSAPRTSSGRGRRGWVVAFGDLEFLEDRVGYEAGQNQSHGLGMEELGDGQNCNGREWCQARTAREGQATGEPLFERATV